MHDPHRRNPLPLHLRRSPGATRTQTNWISVPSRHSKDEPTDLAETGDDHTSSRREVRTCRPPVVGFPSPQSWDPLECTTLVTGGYEDTHSLRVGDTDTPFLVSDDPWVLRLSLWDLTPEDYSRWARTGPPAPSCPRKTGFPDEVGSRYSLRQTRDRTSGNPRRTRSRGVGGGPVEEVP